MENELKWMHGSHLRPQSLPEADEGRHPDPPHHPRRLSLQRDHCRLEKMARAACL